MKTPKHPNLSLGRDNNLGHLEIVMFSVAGRCLIVRKSSRVDNLAQFREIRDENALMPPFLIIVRDLRREICNSSRDGTLDMCNGMQCRHHQSLNNTKQVREQHSMLCARFSELFTTSLLREGSTKCCDQIFGRLHTCNDKTYVGGLVG
jgi:hypothetical protein